MPGPERRLRASVVVPTRARAGYLDVALASIAPQAADAGAEVVVVSDGEDAATAAVATRHGARCVVSAARGANAARNRGLAACAGELVVFCDDDIRACEGWLARLLAAADATPTHDVFGGPIIARLEGGGPRACGREPAPITTLELGPVDRDAAAVWSANMAVRRGSFVRVGPFDETIHGRGEEEDWQRRLTAAGGRIRYVAAARVEHRRTAEDSRLGPLARAQFVLGRSARRYDVLKGSPPSRTQEIRVLAGCLWHVLRRRCAVGVVLAAHATGRVRELRDERGDPPVGHPSRLQPIVMAFPHTPGPRDFLSGTSGGVWGIRASARAIALDAFADAARAVTGRGRRLARAGAAGPARRILALGIEREDAPNLLSTAVAEIERSHHDVSFVATTVGGRGKFENLDRLLSESSLDGVDWLLLLDDDVALPSGFLDDFIFLAERFGLRLAQPAHRHRSHAAWAVTRRRAFTVVRETAFVEIGPVVALHCDTFPALLPFPALRFGWGLDAHWSALARDQGWPIGVVDAVPVRHGMRRIAAAYAREDAIAEGARFLAGRPYTPAAQARRTLVAHRSWR